MTFSYFPFKKLLFIATFVFSLPVALYLLSTRTNFFGRASGESANLMIDGSLISNRSGALWRNLAQGGEEKGRMLASVIEKTRALRPQYIRLDHVFDYFDVVGRSPDGRLTYNWQKLDETLADITAIGAKPLISLSYMPSVMGNGDSTDAPNNWGEWQLLVRATIEHISRRTPDVYYEVWNEPDLFGNWKVYGKKNYLDLYYYSAIGAREAQNVLDFKIGGPATTALYENWMEQFLEFVRTKTLRLDFYSWHRYSTNLDQFEGDVFQAQQWKNEAAARFADMELVITEMGHDSKNHKGYDNSFGAIHTITTAALMDGFVDRAFSFEIKDGPGPEKLWGRWGILTHEKFGTPEEKPRYQALLFLNQMESPRRITITGQGSWVKAFGSEINGTYKVLISNFDPNGTHVETVPINFVGIPGVNYTYRRTDFLGRRVDKAIEVSGGAFQTVEYFAANSAAIVELIPR